MKKLFILLAVAVMAAGCIFVDQKKYAEKFTIADESQTGEVAIQSFNSNAMDWVVGVQNNTDNTLYSVTCRVVYFDEQGNQIDYYDATNSFIEIEGHMAKRIVIGKPIREYPFHKAEIRLIEYNF